MTMTPTGGMGKTIAEKKSKNDKIRALNDQFRKDFKSSQVFLTLDIAQLGVDLLKRLTNEIKAYSDFKPSIDLEGQRSQGVLEIENHTIKWHIEYWDVDEEHTSPDPSNGILTTRTLTIYKK